MKTLARPRDKAELLERLKAVPPDADARWGRMSAHQMICHLSDSFRILTGEKTVSDASGFLERTIVKWVALYAPLAWPAGIATRPELDQCLGGTAPADFARDVALVESLVETVTAPGTNRSAWPPHPIFGRMSESAWLRRGYLHTDHHLRQFGA
jgi:hypothetical protein